MSEEKDKGLGVTLDCFERKIKEPDPEAATDNAKNTERPKTAEEKEIENMLSGEGPDADSGPPEVTIVRREEWSKIERPGEYITYKEPLKFVLMTHTGTSSCSKSDECIRLVRTLQRVHIALGYADIIYNFLIGGDGKVYEGRGWEWESAWIPKYDEEIGQAMKIAQIGYYGDHSKKKLEQKQEKLMCDLIEVGMYKEAIMWNASMITDYNVPSNIDIL